MQKDGLNRDLNPGPPAPKAGIIPLDHLATSDKDSCSLEEIELVQGQLFKMAQIVSVYIMKIHPDKKIFWIQNP